MAIEKLKSYLEDHYQDSESIDFIWTIQYIDEIGTKSIIKIGAKILLVETRCS